MITSIRERWTAWLLLVVSPVCLASPAAEPLPSNALTNAPAPAAQRGQFVHDPSTMAQCGSEYWVFSTGPGITSWHSRDRKQWQSGPRVFERPPSWTTNEVPGFRGYFWAPDIIQAGNRYLLYYSVSSWGKNTSAIGLATNPTLDPADRSFGWADQGPVIQSRQGDTFNTIDPSALKDRDGSLWLAFGSFWTGIKLIELNRETGKRVAPDSSIASLAAYESIEAPCLWQRAGHYYLFVNWGLCCRGTNSTYNIRVGGSDKIGGPYLDKDGRDLLHGGGTLFLGSEGRWIGPGHAGIHREGETDWFSFHFYDSDREGHATLAVRQLVWTADGWPELAPER